MKEYDALITVCFGTGDNNIFENTFELIHNSLKGKLNIKNSYIALSSNYSLKALNDNGKKILSSNSVFESLKTTNNKNLLVVGLFLSYGKGWKDLCRLCDEYRDIYNITLIPPILTNTEYFAKGICQIINNSDVIFIGHGSLEDDNSLYYSLENRLKKMGKKNIGIVLLHSGDKMPKINDRASIYFLMLCAGHHAKEFFEESNNNNIVKYGLAEIDKFRELIINTIMYRIKLEENQC